MLSLADSKAFALSGPTTLGTYSIRNRLFGIRHISDLSESLIKRELDVKDSGFLFPGMGGVWDVTDSIMGAATPAYLVLISAQDFCRPA